MKLTDMLSDKHPKKSMGLGIRSWPLLSKAFLTEELWKSILGGWDKFLKACQFILGEGQRVRLWHDC